METWSLVNGVKIPKVGLGTWQLTNRKLLEEIVPFAYKLGYSMFDTAAAYGNEIAISKAIRNANIPRESIFLSDKLWNTDRGYEAAQEACKKSLKKLKTDFLDLYLVHWPASPALYSNWEDMNAETWRGLERLYQDGFVRAIGVCNFKKHQLLALMKEASFMPMVNQVELHPGMPQEEIVAFCSENHILVEASSPLGNGKILQNPRLCHIAEERKRTVAQICLQWAVRKGITVIPKTGSPARLKENIDIFDFTLTEAEIMEIDTLAYCGGIGLDSDTVTEFG